MPSPPRPSRDSSTQSLSPSLTISSPPTSTSISPAPSASPPSRPYIDPFDADSDAEAPEPSTQFPSTQSPTSTAAAPTSTSEHSDFPLLRRTHLTTGYRAGLSAGKEDPEIAQRGFDAGYGMGATLGARVGWVLGALVTLRALAVRMEEEGRAEVLRERLGEVEAECSVEKLAAVVEGVEGPQTVEERERSEGLEGQGMRAAEGRLQRWVDVVEELGKELGVELKFRGMIGECMLEDVLEDV